MPWDQEQQIKALVFVRRRATNLGQVEQFIQGLAGIEQVVADAKTRLSATIAVLNAAISDPDATSGEVTQMTTFRGECQTTLTLLATLPEP